MTARSEKLFFCESIDLVAEFGCFAAVVCESLQFHVGGRPAQNKQIGHAWNRINASDRFQSCSDICIFQCFRRYR